LEVAVRRVFACISLVVATVSLGCAARQPVAVAPPTSGSGDALAPPEQIVVAPFPPPDGALPKFGEYVFVEKLPEVVTKVAPQYPGVARESGVEGTVMVQALVGKDGRVTDTRIIKSIPMLDEAAAAAVRQWIFNPAEAHEQPVAVWVAVPVKFGLH
jgi:TonB family protein